MFDCRNYTPTDFPMVHAWWEKHHGNEFRPGFISPTAYIVTRDSADVGFFSMHSMQCDFCYLGFPMVNPEVENRAGIVDYIVECSKLWADKTGHKIVYISINNEKMLKRLENAGFLTAETGCSHMFCKVGEVL